MVDRLLVSPTGDHRRNLLFGDETDSLQFVENDFPLAIIAFQPVFKVNAPRQQFAFVLIATAVSQNEIEGRIPGRG